MPPTCQVRPLLLGDLDRGAEQAEIGDGGEIVRAEDVAVHGAVGRGGRGDDDVADGELVAQAAGGADADGGLHAVFGEQLGDVDAERRLAHAGCLDADRPALPGAGEAQAVAHGVHLARRLEEGLGDPFGPERVAGQQDGLGVIALRGFVMRGHGWHSSGFARVCSPDGAGAKSGAGSPAISGAAAAGRLPSRRKRPI